VTAPTNNNQAPDEAAKALSVTRNRILDTVMQYAENIEALAPRGMLATYYVQELRLYLAQPDKDGNPSKLLDCTPASIVRGMLRVAQTGLSLGVSCDLLPFKQNCQFSPRYNGIIELALNSGVRTINADAVYDDDLLWDFQKGTEFFVRHKRGPRKGKLTHFWATAEIKQGSFAVVVLTRDEVEAHKAKYSKQWYKVPIEDCLWYGTKTAIRQLSKFVPKNPRFAAALQFDRQEEEEIPEGEYELIHEAALGHSIMDSRPDARSGEPASINGNGSAPKAQGTSNLESPCNDEQRERLLDLVEHKGVPADVRELIEIRLKLGTMTEKGASDWIREMEMAIAGASKGEREMAGLGV
jgi:phage RecT family recombinase